MSNDRIAVIDVETTGLFPWRHDRIVEIGIVVCSPDGQVHTEFDSLINPNRDMGPASIHRIAAGDVLRAPTFADLAGDILQILRDTMIVAGHNVSFDRAFLVHEFMLAGVTLPDFPVLCTYRLLGGSLAACCEEFGIEMDVMEHRAICDARATARILACVCADDPSLLHQYRLTDLKWPFVRPLNTPCYCREHAEAANSGPPRFLQRLAGRLRHDADAEPPNVLAYLALVDRVLEDRRIDEHEHDLLLEAASSLGLSMEQVRSVHCNYIENLAVAALADGVITDSEQSDLHLVARLLGHDRSQLDSYLKSVAAQLKGLTTRQQRDGDGSMRGQRVCFTGELQSKWSGGPLCRSMAESLARAAGLIPVSNVTKATEILVVSDPNTQSGKAKKARRYGTRIMHEAVFWRAIGVEVE